jgi:hypothetical protein
VNEYAKVFGTRYLAPRTAKGGRLADPKLILSSLTRNADTGAVNLRRREATDETI